MSGMDMEFILTGAKTGQTILLGKHAFVNGACKVFMTPESANAILTFLGRSYQAYPRGSAELEVAQERDREYGLLNDLPESPKKADGSPDSVSGDSDHAPGSVSDPRALHGGADDGSEAGRSGLVPGGAGHEDAGMGEGVESGEDFEPLALTHAVQRICGLLDPKQDEHWSDGGLPSVSYVAAAVRNERVSRELIDQACPGWTRLRAEDLAAETVKA
jgi:hypothetical protein